MYWVSGRITQYSVFSSAHSIGIESWIEPSIEFLSAIPVFSQSSRKASIAKRACNSTGPQRLGVSSEPLGFTKTRHPRPLFKVATPSFLLYSEFQAARRSAAPSRVGNGEPFGYATLQNDRIFPCKISTCLDNCCCCFSIAAILHCADTWVAKINPITTATIFFTMYPFAFGKLAEYRLRKE
jgi:hypothetical protein